MKNLFEAARLEEIKARLAELTPNSERQWGSMTPAQALAHCSASVEWAVGDTVPPRLFLLRLAGVVVKPFLLGDDKPMRRNAPTVKALVVQDDRNLDAERDRLCRLVERFSAGDPAGCTRNPHSFFGRLTPAEWGILVYKHLDHHLRQFGV